jgi:hypothetical protein
LAANVDADFGWQAIKRFNDLRISGSNKAWCAVISYSGLASRRPTLIAAKAFWRLFFKSASSMENRPID